MRRAIVTWRFGRIKLFDWDADRFGRRFALPVGGTIGAIVLGLIMTGGMRQNDSTKLPVVVEMHKTPPFAAVMAESSQTIDAHRSPYESAFATLPEITLFNVNTKQYGKMTLYDGRGNVDETAAAVADELLADNRRKGQTFKNTIDRRVLQILVRSAYHFRLSHVEIISGFRKPTYRREGYHALGKAVDYRIVGVEAVELARYLRQIPKLGVGVYIHPKTQYVHLDVRDVSYHWLDASPPRRRWRARSIGGRSLIELDKRYRRIDDWPEGYSPFVDEREIGR